jgi:hypothetical protein
MAARRSDAIHSAFVLHIGGVPGAHVCSLLLGSHRFCSTFFPILDFSFFSITFIWHVGKHGY